MNPIKLTGQTFGRLTVIARSPELPGSSHAHWLCQCSCGSQSIVRGSHLRNGLIKSCGCYNKQIHTTHGMYGTKIRGVWSSMKQRCSNQNNPGWKDYGGRGISVCKEWQESLSAFILDMGPRPPGYSLERIENDLGYSPGNCRWATKMEQMNNRRANGKRAFIQKVLKRELKEGEVVRKIVSHYIACEEWFHEFLRSRLRAQLRRNHAPVSNLSISV